MTEGEKEEKTNPKFCQWCRSFICRDSNWKLFYVNYPVGTHTSILLWGDWTKNDKTLLSQCVPSRCLWYQHVSQKSALKIAAFHISDWLRWWLRGLCGWVHSSYGLSGRKVTLNFSIQSSGAVWNGPYGPYGLCRRKATVNLNDWAQSSWAAWKSRWPCWARLPIPNSPCGLCGQKATLKLNSTCTTELRSCVRGKMAILGSPSMIVIKVSVDARLH